MAGGWTADGAVQQQIDDSIADAVQRVRAQLQRGPGLERCAECDAEIPAARRAAIPGVTLCVDCQAERDRRAPAVAGPYNRRGSKDSQLR